MKVMNVSDSQCRLCMQRIKSQRYAVTITKEIAQIFLELTSLELLMADNYPSRACVPCVTDLNRSHEIRLKFIEHQITLYSYEEEQTESEFVDINIKAEELDEPTAITEIKTELYDPPEIIEEAIAGLDSIETVFIAPESLSTEEFSNDKTLTQEEEFLMVQCSAPEMCPYCGKFVSVDAMSQHIENHEKRTKNFFFICDFCGFEAFKKLDIKRHQRTVHKKPAKLKQPSKHVDIRRKIVIKHIKNPNLTVEELAKMMNVSKVRTKRTLKIFQETGSVEIQIKVPGPGSREDPLISSDST